MVPVLPIHTHIDIRHTRSHLFNPLDCPKMASPSDHQATIIDGKAIALTIRPEIASEVSTLSEKHSKVAGLAVVIVGCRMDSQSYVSIKRKACAEVGIKSFDIDLPEDVREVELIAKVDELNANPEVHE